MKQPEWILRDVVIALQEELLAEFGGLSGIRDEGLFASAFAHPENLFAYDASSVFELAASYGFGLIKNHPSLDGNKCIAFTVAVLFLEINGCRFQAAEADAVIRTLALAAGKMSESAYAEWLKDNSQQT